MQIPRLSEERNLPNQIDLIGPNQATFRAGAALSQEVAQVGVILDNAAIADEKVEAQRFATEAATAMQTVLQDKTIRDPDELVGKFNQSVAGLRKAATSSGSYRSKQAKQQALESLIRSGTDNLLSRRNALFIDRGKANVEGMKQSLLQFVANDPGAEDAALASYSSALSQGFHERVEAAKELVDLKRQFGEQAINRSPDEYFANRAAGKYRTLEPDVQRQLDAYANSKVSEGTANAARLEKARKKLVFDHIMSAARGGKFGTPAVQAFAIDQLSRDMLSKSDYELARDIAEGRLSGTTTSDDTILFDAGLLAAQPGRNNEEALADVTRGKGIVLDMVRQRRLGRSVGSSYLAFEMMDKLNSQERFLRGEGLRFDQRDYARAKDMVTREFYATTGLAINAVLSALQKRRLNDLLSQVVGSTAPMDTAKALADVLRQEKSNRATQEQPTKTPFEEIEERRNPSGR